TLPKLPFQIEDYKAKLEEGYKLVGWSETEGAETAEYELGAKVVLTREKPVVDLYPVYGQMDLFSLKLYVLYLDEKSESGYRISEEIRGEFQCVNYGVDHPEDGYLHQISRTNLYEKAQEYLTLETGYEFVGILDGKVSANPELLDMTKTSMLNYSNEFPVYLVAKKVEEPENPDPEIPENPDPE
ncbi:MAG: hypothetical protein Q4D90_10650, partial [bacterium]|nr:hypothetical protein [bacterium]